MIYQEIFEFPINQFTSHIEKKDNDRILFSGRYGIGKTSFLKEYFFQDNVQKKFEAFHLFPVNYSIATNEDIIRYIKYDIIFQLLEKNRQIDQSTKTYLQNLPKFAAKNLDKIVAAFLYMIPKIGKDIIASYEKWNELVKEFLKFHDESNISDGDQLAAYLGKIESTDGGLFESDIITDLIIRILRDNGNRESVLIVDDLDRLDPEHVFRIMNVFAAHFDMPGSNKLKADAERVELKNKFGFDKIILVCDFCNVESIFYYKYGMEVDFAGYADKFYSSEVYHFDNKAAIISIVNNCLKKACEVNVTNSLKLDYLKQLIFQDGFLQAIIEFFVHCSFINLRNVLKIESVKIDSNAELSFSSSHTMPVTMLPIVIKLRLLRDIIGDSRRLQFVLSNCKGRRMPFERYDLLFGIFLFICRVDQVGPSIRSDKIISYNGGDKILGFDDSYYDSLRVYVYDCEIADDGKPKRGKIYKPSADELWVTMVSATSKLIETGYL